MNQKWTTDWLNLFNAGELDEMIKLYVPDVDFEDRILNRKENTAVGVKAFCETFFQENSGRHAFHVHRYSGDESGGAAEWIWEATDAAGFIGVPNVPKGTITRVKGVSVLRFRDNKIAAQWDYWDSASLFEQLKASQ